jgi:hypothetical protein
MTFDEIKLGDTYYIVKNTTNGAKVQAVEVKTKLYGIKAVIVVDENERVNKIYQDSLKSLLTIEEAITEKNKLKKVGPIKSPTIGDGLWTTCWRCGANINRKTSKRCSICGWHKCPICGACHCDYSSYH